MLRLLCLLSVCLYICVSDVDQAWAKFRQKKYTSFIITEGVGEDGEPIETIEDTITQLSKFNGHFKSNKKVWKLNACCLCDQSSDMEIIDTV